MTSRSRMALITIIVVIIVAAGAILTYIYRDQLFTAVGTETPFPGASISIENLANGTDLLNVTPGEDLNFTVNVVCTSTGGGFCPWFNMSVDYDPSFLAVSNISAGGVDSGGTVDWPGDPAEPIPANLNFSFTGTVSATAAPNTVSTSTATVFSEFGSPTSTVTMTVPDIVAPADPDLKIFKNVVDENGAPVEPGDLLTYSISLENEGQGVATNISVLDDVGPFLDNFKIMGTPTGSVDASQLAPAGANGTGLVDVSGFALNPTEGTDIVYTVTVDNAAQNGQQIDNTAIATYSLGQISDSAQVIVDVPAGPVVVPDDEDPGTPVPSVGTTQVPTSTPPTTQQPVQVAQQPTSTAQPTPQQTTPIVVPEVGVDPTVAVAVGSGAVSLLIGGGYVLNRRKRNK